MKPLFLLALLCCAHCSAADTQKKIKIPKSLIKKTGMSEEVIRAAYAKHLNADHAPTPINATTYATRIAPKDPVVVALAAFLCKKVKPEEQMEKIIWFVQGIKYKKDPLETVDYVKHPIETLCEKEGDCEDLAILAASLLIAAGHDAIIVMLPNKDINELDHLVLGAVTSEKGKKVKHGGKEYTLIEVTGREFGIGDVPRFWQEYDFSRLTAAGAQ